MNTLEQLRTDAAANANREMPLGSLCEMIKSLSPAEYNSIIIDNAVPVKRFDYCYISAFVQKLDYKAVRRSAAIGSQQESQLLAIKQLPGEGPYARLDNKSIVEQMEDAPTFSDQSFISSAREKVGLLIKGGLEVEHKLLQLDTTGDCLAKQQPLFAVKAECNVMPCPECKGTGIESKTDKEGAVIQGDCPKCKGLKKIGTISYIAPTVSEKEINIIRCNDGNIENLKTSTLEAHKGDDTTRVRMLTHFNGVDMEDFDEYIRQYLDPMRDKTGQKNAVEEIYYHIIPCYTFRYRNVLTGEIRTGVLVDPYRKPEIILRLDSTSSKLLGGMKDGIKNINRFFGSIGKTSAHKDKEDLVKTARLLIAVAVADGDVSEEEKKSLTLTIRDMDALTGSQRDELLQLLGSKDSSFLTDDDFKFHSKQNAEEALARMQEVASADGTVHEEERLIIEKMKLSI